MSKRRMEAAEQPAIVKANKSTSSDPRNPKYKMTLCNHWERTNGTWCARGKQCGYAHGLFELRHKRLIQGETRDQSSRANWRRNAQPSPKAREVHTNFPETERKEEV